MAVPQVCLNTVQRIILAAKIRLLHMRGAEKASVEGIRPAVVGALDAAFEVTFGGRTDARAAVAANIEKGLHASAGIARDNDAFSCNLTENVVAGAWNFSFAAGIHPHLRIEAVHLVAENLRVGVVALRKSLWRGRHFYLHVFPEVLRLSGILCHNEKGDRTERRLLATSREWRVGLSLTGSRTAVFRGASFWDKLPRRRLGFRLCLGECWAAQGMYRRATRSISLSSAWARRVCV